MVRGRQHAVPVCHRQLRDLVRGDGGGAGVEGCARSGRHVGFECGDPALDLLAGGLLRLGGGDRWEYGNEGEGHAGGDGRIGSRSRELGLKGVLGGR